MTTLPKSFLIASIACFVLGLTGPGGDLVWCLLYPMTAVLFILFFVVAQGMQALNLEFFTGTPKPVGEVGGGMANAIIGTLTLSALGSTFAIPIGILSGVYMSEYAGSRSASAVSGLSQRQYKILGMSAPNSRSKRSLWSSPHNSQSNTPTRAPFCANDNNCLNVSSGMYLHFGTRMTMYSAPPGI